MVRSFKLSEGATEIAKQLMADGNDFKSSVLMAIRLADETEPSDDVLKILARDEKFTKPLQGYDEAVTRFAQQNDNLNQRDEDLLDFLPTSYGRDDTIFNIQNYTIPNEWDELKPIIQKIAENRKSNLNNQLTLPGFTPKEPVTFYSYLDDYEKYAEALVNKYGPNPTIRNFRREVMDDRNPLYLDGEAQVAPMADYYRAQQARRYALQQLGLYNPVYLY